MNILFYCSKFTHFKKLVYTFQKNRNISHHKTIVEAAEKLPIGHNDRGGGIRTTMTNQRLWIIKQEGKGRIGRKTVTLS